MAKVHYIGMSGAYGCTPDYCASFETVGAACASLAEVHELDFGDGQTLLENWYIDLQFGADYAEITECDCAEPGQHNDE